MYFKHKHYKKGEYIFHNFAKSDNFYGVIKGAVSIRGMNCKQVVLNKYDEIEKEEIVEKAIGR